MTLRSLSVLALVVLAGCQPAGRPQKRGVRESSYYPLKVGTTWTYRGPGHKHVMRVAGHEVIDGIACAQVETLRDEEVIEENAIFANAEGVYILVANGQKLSPPLPILKLPPRPGRSWPVNFNKGGQQSKGMYLLGEDDVEVPAGTYHAVTLNGEINEGTTRTLSFTYWFAPGVGIVKQVLKKAGRTMVYELERFEAPR